jgi:hypothetical protein
MEKIFKTAILGIAMMFSVNFAFAQEATGSGDPEVDYSTPSAAYKLSVTIVDKGHNCPPSGEILSSWLWLKNGSTYPQWKSGTKAYYDYVPMTVQVEGIYPDVPGVFLIQQASVTINPNAQGGVNTIYVNKPFNPVEISAGSCYPGEQNVIYPNTTE